MAQLAVFTEEFDEIIANIYTVTRDKTGIVSKLAYLFHVKNKNY